MGPHGSPGWGGDVPGGLLIGSWAQAIVLWSLHKEGTWVQLLGSSPVRPVVGLWPPSQGPAWNK